MTDPITHPNSSKLLRASIWVAIGALIAAALVCVVWALLGDSNGMVGRAFLTILLLTSFAGVSILEANLASRRPAWFALASMVTWVAALLIGAFLIWMPDAGRYYGEGMERFAKFLGIILILQLALLHIRLYIKAHERHRTTFTSIVTYVTIGFVVILAVMLVLPLMLGEFARFLPIYWRVVVALAILAAVGTALVPLVNALFAPKAPRERRVDAVVPPVMQWPTYADGATPLPVMPDGSPDWNAYYTGQPTYPHGDPVAPPLPAPPAQQAIPSVQTAAPSASQPTSQPQQTMHQGSGQPSSDAPAYGAPPSQASSPSPAQPDQDGSGETQPYPTPPPLPPR